MFNPFHLKPYPKVKDISEVQKEDLIKIGNDLRKVLGLSMYKEKVKIIGKTTKK